MRKVNFNQNWKVKQIDTDNRYKDVDLPYDAMIFSTRRDSGRTGSRKGYFSNGAYEFVKVFDLEKNENEGKIFIEFEGVYKNAFVYINGLFLKNHPNGYTNFIIDITDYVCFDKKNVIKVVCSSNDDSRWYSGTGIYRDVNLYFANKKHFELESVQVKTNKIKDGEAEIEIQSLHNGDRAIYEIYDNNDCLIITSTENTINVPNPNLWSDKHPYLYKLKCILFDNNHQVDEYITSFGIRTIELVPQKGLLINGEITKLRGTCIHHDNGILGAVSYQSIEDRKIRKIKEAGFNAVRIAHHPAGRYILEACDKYGIYVMNEAFDMWQIHKTPDDYANYFNDYFKSDIKSLVNTSFNHPSVIIYSVGNEIPDLANKHGNAILKNLINEVKVLDKTRPVTCAINGVMLMMEALQVHNLVSDNDVLASNDVNETMSSIRDNIKNFHRSSTMDHFLKDPISILDLPGYNYMPERYEVDNKNNPNLLIVGTESYPFEFYDIYSYMKDNNNVVGDFLWIGWDYLGEAGIGKTSYEKDDVHSGIYGEYPYLTGDCADIDITGFRLPSSYLHEITMGLSKKPYIVSYHPKHFNEKPHYSLWGFYDVTDSYDYLGYEGKDIKVDVYSSSKSITLFLNDEFIGKSVVDKNIATFTFKYEPGILKAVDEEGNEALLETPNTETVIDIDVFEDTLVYVDVYLKDSNGNIHFNKDQTIKIDVIGGQLLGFGSGAPTSEETYIDNIHSTYHGHALAIIKRNSEEVEIIVATSNQEMRKKI